MKKHRTLCPALSMFACGLLACASDSAFATDNTFVQINGTASNGSACPTAGMLARATDDTGLLTCLGGKWTVPVNRTYTAEFTYLNKPLSQGGFPSIVTLGPSVASNESQVSYAQCSPGSLKSASVTVGWHYSITQITENEFRVMATAQELDPDAPRPTKGCLQGTLNVRVAVWDEIAKLKAGESVTLEERNGFTAKITRGNNLID